MKKKMMKKLLIGVAAVCIMVCGENISGETAKQIYAAQSYETKDEAFGTREDILKVSKIAASVEEYDYKCNVDVMAKHNPYDVVWDYGDKYNKYIKECDWKKVFDAEYYKKTFPMLAMLYNNDDQLLLEHFYTVGIHEGRQGSENFNVGAYRYNSNLEQYFGDNYAAYYIYYLMNYNTEKKINTIKAPIKTEIQYKICATKLQKTELKEVNAYRKEVGVSNAVFDGELMAFANYRAYVNITQNYKAHDWSKKNNESLKNYLKIITNGSWSSYGENNICCTRYRSSGFAKLYRDSKEHYDTMVSGKYNYIGVSNVYIADKKNKGEQFDLFINITK